MDKTGATVIHAPTICLIPQKPFAGMAGAEVRHEVDERTRSPDRPDRGILLNWSRARSPVPICCGLLRPLPKPSTPRQRSSHPSPSALRLSTRQPPPSRSRLRRPSRRSMCSPRSGPGSRASGRIRRGFRASAKNIAARPWPRCVLRSSQTGNPLRPANSRSPPCFRINFLPILLPTGRRCRMNSPGFSLIRKSPSPFMIPASQPGMLSAAARVSFRVLAAMVDRTRAGSTVRARHRPAPHSPYTPPATPPQGLAGGVGRICRESFSCPGTSVDSTERVSRIFLSGFTPD